MIKCEVLTMTVEFEGEAIFITDIPAYTVKPQDLQDRVDSLVEDYFDRSNRDGQPVSLGDLVLFLAAQAALDPKEQE